MREPERIDRILKLIRELWDLDSDLRFLQLIFNLERKYSMDNQNEGLRTFTQYENGIPWENRYTDLCHLEDDKLEKYLIDLLAQMKSKIKNK